MQLSTLLSLLALCALPSQGRPTPTPGDGSLALRDADDAVNYPRPGWKEDADDAVNYPRPGWKEAKPRDADDAVNCPRPGWKEDADDSVKYPRPGWKENAAM